MPEFPTPSIMMSKNGYFGYWYAHQVSGHESNRSVVYVGELLAKGWTKIGTLDKAVRVLAAERARAASESLGG